MVDWVGDAQENADNTSQHEPLDDSELMDTMGESWKRGQLSRVWDDDWVPPEPSLVRRIDGAPMFYRGKLHDINGDPLTGKSMMLATGAVQVMNEGGHVVFIDGERTREEVEARLRVLGLPKQTASELWDYVRPTESLLRKFNKDEGAVTRAIRQRFGHADLAIFDGFESQKAREGFGQSNHEIVQFINLFMKPLVFEGGPAVAYIGHLQKYGSETTKGQSGGMQNFAQVDVSYRLENQQELVPGVQHLLTNIYLDKDTPTRLTPHSVKSDNAKYIAMGRRAYGQFGMVVCASGKHVVAEIAPPTLVHDNRKVDRPTINMERLCLWAERQIDGLTGGTFDWYSGKDLEKPDKNDGPGMNAAHVRDALDILLNEGYWEKATEATKQTDPDSWAGGHPKFRMVKPYRKVDDPRAHADQRGQKFEDTLSLIQRDIAMCDCNE